MIYACIAVAFILLAESPTWRGYTRRLQHSTHDRSTSTAITLATLMGIAAGLLIFAVSAQSQHQPWPHWTKLVAVALSGLGSALRCWSIRSLGASFTLTLQVEQGQSVVDTGPYRFIRHPSYLGGELALLGLGLLCGNVWSAVCFCGPLLVAHLFRIEREERMLSAELKDAYAEYTAKTDRLIPGVY